VQPHAGQILVQVLVTRQFIQLVPDFIVCPAEEDLAQDRGSQLDLSKATLGSFANFLPHIQGRFGLSGTGPQPIVTDLPVRPDFQETFTKWADGQVSFKARPDSGPHI